MLVTIIILTILLITVIVMVRNLLIKVEKYEDLVQDQVGYLQNISTALAAGKKHLDELDQKGTFASDDEVGEYFKNLKKVQEELNRYMLPENYGEKEE